MRVIPSEARQALRRLAATPALSAAAILTLAIGIGSAVVMVDVLDRLLVRAPAHVTDPDRVARIYVRLGDSYIDRTGYATFEALASMRDELEASAAYFTESLSLGRASKARQVEAVAHSGGYFDVLGLQPAIGSWADPPNPAREDAAVISHALWQQEFGGAPDVLGKPLRFGLDTYTIVAVAPRGFRGIGWKPADVWLPLVPRARATYGQEWKSAAMFLQMMARLRPGVSRERANEIATAGYRARHTQPGEKKRSVVLGDIRPARGPGAPAGTRVEVLVAGMSLVVLIITCGNVANLLLVRGLRRDREFVVKTALGASRVRLVREVLLEASLLAAGAGVVSLVVVITGGTLMRRLFLSPITALASPLDGRLVLITAALCGAAAFLLGLTPAFRLTTRRALSPGQSAVVRPSRLLDLFSGLQVALSLPMIVAAALFVLSLWNAQNQDLGMQTSRVTVVSTNLFEVGRPWENHAVHRQMQARLAALPQVESTAVIQNLPMRSSVTFFIYVPGKPVPAGPVSSDDLPMHNPVDPSFFTVMRMRLIEGRFFTEAENRKGARPVAVITEAMAKDSWPGEPAVGKCFHLYGRENPSCTEVVGVVADARLYPSIRPTKQWASAYYVPIEQTASSSSRALLVRTVGEPESVLQTLRREAQAAAPDLPYVDAHAFDAVFMNMLKPWRLGSIVFVVFGVLSMAIAAVGLAVVGAYGVTRRKREIGIRSALGAGPGHLVRLVLGRSLFVVATGLAAGMGLAWAGGRILRAQLFDVSATDPRVFAAAAAGMLLVGIVAAWLPARRAARIDPVTALRAE